MKFPRFRDDARRRKRNTDIHEKVLREGNSPGSRDFFKKNTNDVTSLVRADVALIIPFPFPFPTLSSNLGRGRL